MSRRRKRRRDDLTSTHIANQQWLPPRDAARVLTLLEDNRQFAFGLEDVRHPAVVFDSAPARVIADDALPPSERRSRSARSMTWPAPTVSFAEPQNVVVCARRQKRREVLFAKRKTGRSGQRRPIRNRWSDVRC